MPTRRAPKSDREWLSIITECRQSGLPDKVWCDQQGIPASTFYNAVSRLRKHACELPDKEPSAAVLDLTNRQEAVPICIVPDRGSKPDSLKGQLYPSGPGMNPVHPVSDMHLDNSHMIEIVLNSSLIRIYNGTDPELMRYAVQAVGSLLC